MQMTGVQRRLVKGLVLLTAGMAAVQPFGWDGLTSVLLAASFPMVAALWIVTTGKQLTGRDLWVLGTLALAAIAVLTELVVRRVLFSFGYFKKLVMFAATLLFFSVAGRLQNTASLRGFVAKVAMALAAVFWAAFLFRRDAMYLHQGAVSAYLTMGFTNPNLAALFLSMTAMLLACRAKETGRWVLYGAAAAMAYLAVLTKARNVLVALAVFGLLLPGKRQRLRFPGIWAWSPLVLAMLYLILVRQPFVQQMLQFLTEEGKSLDSRVEIWEGAMQMVARWPLLGAYGGISGGTGVSQMHNSHLDVAASYGVPVLVSVCTLLRQWLKAGRGVYGIGFLGAVLLGFGEAAVFSGGLGIYIFAGVFLLLAKEEDHAIGVHQQLFQSPSETAV